VIVWPDEFPASYRVPRDVERLVMSGMVEDMSWRNDPSPSFGAKLKDKNWFRLWVEHPDVHRRIGWPHRYTLVVQPEPAVPFGWKLLGTDDLAEALLWAAQVVRMKGPKCRFRVTED
jgi:hypothetical protein